MIEELLDNWEKHEDEINSRIWCWDNGYEYHGHNTLDDTDTVYVLINGVVQDVHKYTRDLNACFELLDRYKRYTIDKVNDIFSIHILEDTDWDGDKKLTIAILKAIATKEQL